MQACISWFMKSCDRLLCLWCVALPTGILTVSTCLVAHGGVRRICRCAPRSFSSHSLLSHLHISFRLFRLLFSSTTATIVYPSCSLSSSPFFRVSYNSSVSYSVSILTNTSLYHIFINVLSSYDVTLHDVRAHDFDNRSKTTFPLNSWCMTSRYIFVQQVKHNSPFSNIPTFAEIRYHSRQLESCII